jgi:uncharacterized protein YwqG
MSSPLEINLLPELELCRSKLEDTIQPYLEIKIAPNSHLTWWQSKFGGLPYLPKNVEYPKSIRGDYLFLLAQINFAELPHLNSFPKQGIIQFYIANDDLYGASFEYPIKQDEFRVLYFPEPKNHADDLITDFNFLSNSSEDSLPIVGSFSLDFTQKKAPISFSDYYFEKLLKASIDNIDRDRYYELIDWYEEHFPSNGHRIGGYPFFTQFDPREKFSDVQEPYNVLLLQIDTDYQDEWEDRGDIMWGDAGVCNFFIQESKLKQLDFTEVFYNWDCG